MSTGSPTIAPERAEAPEIPEHELLRPIASGAYGDVWLGRNAVGTLRAVKIVRRDRFERVEDFEREFRGLQRFEPVSRTHEGLVDILQIGREESWFYHVMELADGTRNTKTEGREPKEFYSPRTLRAELKTRGAIAPQEVIALGQQLASALAHLHAQGLVHRDVKPSNILFLAGVPKLADAGLVAAVDDARSVVGTPGYIPPEGPGTPQADIYSLGKVLYECAFGKDRQEFPQLPPNLTSREEHPVLLELNEIILKACAQNPRERYTSAEILRADIEVLQNGGSIRRRYACQRIWAKTKGWVIGLTLLITAAMIGNAIRNSDAADYEGKPSQIEEANQLFRAGQHRYERHTPSDIHAATDFFTRAVQVDTNFAKAYAWLAISQCWAYASPSNWVSDVLPHARQAAERALVLDDSLGKAHLALAWYAMVKDWDWKTTESQFQKALKCSPRDVEIYTWYGYCQAMLGRTNQAIETLRKAVALQPQSIDANSYFGTVLDMARGHEQAIAVFKHVLDMEPSGPVRTFGALSESLVHAGRFEEAIEYGLQDDLQSGLDPDAAKVRRDALLNAYRKNGAAGYWKQFLDWELANTGESDPCARARFYAGSGQIEAALTWLETAEKQHKFVLIEYIKTDRCLDPLRDQPRFKALMGRLGLD